MGDVISADAAFENAADAAAAALAAAPSLVGYRLTSRLISGGVTTDRTCGLVFRTAEGRVEACPGDGPLAKDGGVQLLPPVVDALAEWAFRFDAAGGSVRMTVEYERPKRYVVPTPGPRFDVVVASVSGFAVSYAGPAHLRLEPATPSVREFARGADHFTYRDVWYDPATWLPSRIVVASPDETLALDYTVVAGHWLLARLAYDGVAHARGGRPFRLDASYGEFTFPAPERHSPSLAPSPT